MSKSDLWILGGGGHAATVADALRRRAIAAVVLESASAAERYRGPLVDVAARVLDEDVLDHDDRAAVMLVNGIGKLEPGGARSFAFHRFRERGYSFAQVIHPQAIVSPAATLGEGAQVLAGAIVGPGASIGANTIVNSGAIVEHGVTIGPDCHVASGAVLCGDCVVGKDTLIGAGSTVIQGRSVGAGTVVGAGSTVVTSVGDGLVVYGSPAVGSG